MPDKKGLQDKSTYPQKVKAEKTGFKNRQIQHKILRISETK